MALWICTCCGATELLTFIPDGCSSCGGAMETQDGRSTAAAEDMPHHDMETGAHAGDPAAIIALWQEGRPLTSTMRARLDELLLANRLGLISAVYGAEAA